MEQLVRSINATARVLRAQNSVVDVRELLNIKHFAVDRALELKPEFLKIDEETQHDLRVSTCSTSFEGVLSQGPPGQMGWRTCKDSLEKV